MGAWFLALFGVKPMTKEQIDGLTDIKNSLRHLSTVATGAGEPTRAILTTQIFILIQKVRYLLGEKDGKPVMCGECKGTGKTRNFADASDPSLYDCPMCGGSGELAKESTERNL